MAKILIIDDEELICGMLESLLTRAGHEVDTAFDGAVGLEIYQEKPAQVVITDIIMPESDGLETIKNLKQFNPDVKIIAISGGSRIKQVDFLEVASDLGADHAFYKPLDHAKLMQAVDNCLVS